VRNRAGNFGGVQEVQDEQESDAERGVIQDQREDAEGGAGRAQRGHFFRAPARRFARERSSLPRHLLPLENGRTIETREEEEERKEAFADQKVQGDRVSYPLVFVYYAPEANAKLNMLYASTKSRLSRALDLNKVLFCSCFVFVFLLMCFLCCVLSGLGHLMFCLGIRCYDL
jgi:hypothetical protein